MLYTGGIVNFGFTAIFGPVADEFHWSYAQISWASSLLGFEVGLLGGPVMGFLVDRWGPRKLVMVGSIFIFFGFVLLSRISSLAFFYGAFAVIGLGMSTCTQTVFMTAVGNWFHLKVGVAIGIVAAGFGLGGVLVPVVTKLIYLFDWRTAMLIIGTGTLALVFPLSLIIRNKPEQYGYQPDGNVHNAAKTAGDQPIFNNAEINITALQAIRKRAFWNLALSSMLYALVVNAMLTHIMPFLGTLGIDPSLSSLIAMSLPVLSVIGRLSSGWLAIRLGSRKIFSSSFVLMTAGLLLCAYIYQISWLVIPFIIVFSLGWGCSVTTRVSLLREIFGRHSFGKIIGFVAGMMMIGNIVGAPLTGWIYDKWGSYQGAWIGLSLLTLIAAILVLTIPKATTADSRVVTV